MIAQITAEDEEISEGKIVDIFTALESQIVRGRIIAGEPRIDGRTVDTVRCIRYLHLVYYHVLTVLQFSPVVKRKH